MVRTMIYSTFILNVPFLNFKVTCLITCLLAKIMRNEKRLKIILELFFNRNFIRKKMILLNKFEEFLLREIIDTNFF